MLKAIKEFFLGKPKQAEPEAPYKVEAPAPVSEPVSAPEAAKCGCGRSQSGLCVGLHKLTPEEWAVHESNPNASKKPVAKKRTFKKREEGGTAKVAKIKATPAKKPRAK